MIVQVGLTLIETVKPKTLTNYGHLVHSYYVDPRKRKAVQMKIIPMKQIHYQGKEAHSGEVREVLYSEQNMKQGQHTAKI